MSGSSPQMVVYPAQAMTRAMICEEEVNELAQRYGVPVRRTYHIQADEYIRAYRWRRDSDRRAEVVFAIQEPNGKIWMHNKAHYPAHLCRLPSGGVGWHESIHQALLREVKEETGLEVQICSFVGLLEYRFHHEGSTVKFASYIFHLFCGSQCPALPENEEIYAFRAMMPSQLLQLTMDMRNMIGERRGWGIWRALAHDLMYEHFCPTTNKINENRYAYANT